jgi:geranylgeranyl diphosphate synthase type I
MVTNSNLPLENRPQTAGTLFDELKKVSEKIKSLANKVLDPYSEPQLLYKASRHLILAGGKMLRPYLAVKTCEIVGGSEEDVLPSAAALELLHTFTLIHDDIMDHDRVRRGVTSVHARWGMPMGIVAGDLLFAKVYDMVLNVTDRVKVSDDKILRVLGLITRAAIVICEGQVLDMTFEKKNNVTEQEYIEMVSKKTSYLFKTAAEVGAVIGGGSEKQIIHLGNFAYLIGIGFQIVDDVLGLTADEKELGKPVGSDIREGKKTFPVIHALQNSDSSQKEKLLRALKKKVTREKMLEARELIISLGSINYAVAKAKEYVENAEKQLEIFPKSRAKKDLLDFSAILINRKF